MHIYSESVEITFVFDNHRWEGPELPGSGGDNSAGCSLAINISSEHP